VQQEKTLSNGEQTLLGLPSADNAEEYYIGEIELMLLTTKTIIPQTTAKATATLYAGFVMTRLLSSRKEKSQVYLAQVIRQ
jgi:hypothetical protein